MSARSAVQPEESVLCAPIPSAVAKTAELWPVGGSASSICSSATAETAELWPMRGLPGPPVLSAVAEVAELWPVGEPAGSSSLLMDADARSWAAAPMKLSV